jgi:hypothetical protein
MSNPLSAAEAKELIRLCESGRLYEVEAWIRAGRSLTVPKEVRRTPVSVAVSTGFHSLVELLLRHEENQKVKNDTLQLALLQNQHAFIELAVANGADIASVPFLDVLMTGNRAVVTSFLERGADPIADYPFARAFHELRAKTTLGSHLDCRRIRPDLAVQLQEQADMALRQFCQEDKLRWVCLLACLLELGANPNDKADGGSRALDVCIKHLGWEDFSRKHEYGANDMAPGYKVSRGREAIKVLLRYGALWTPELSTLHKVRRILYRTEPEVTVTLIGMLLSHENGQDAIRELLRVAQMRQHVSSCEGQLSKLGITLDGRRRSEVPTAPAPSAYVVAHYDRERLYVEV